MGMAPAWTAYQLTLSSSKQCGEFDCQRNVYRTERGSANGDSGRCDCQLRETMPELTASTSGRRSGGEPGASDETPGDDGGDSRTLLDTAEPLRGEEQDKLG